MNDQKKPQKSVDVVNLAEKKRHLYLVEKMQKGATLTRVELKELKKFESGDAGMGVVDTHDQLAKIFRVSVRSIANWARDGMPRRDDGRYELMEIFSWKQGRKEDQEKKARNSDGTPQVDDWDQKEKEFKAKQRELDFKQASGELVKASDVKKDAFESARKLRARLSIIPDVIAPHLAAETDILKIKAVIAKSLREALGELSGNA